ncbi:cytochrome c [Caballeronia sordidicola]|uniref:Gluconate 2-dehydrogenase, membrane-bound, cytochrome c n=1 Tax=Caballeronia sordidicola TaxID=196367 RepID=A0A226WQ19_CABSO|nr:cytochrome c [Caballeronia sordidicola]OXC72728.1 Gluconate 2-dehydrogenase, membrane-bound, cytochrome c [Caballeronia sordidicola]
MSFLTRLHCRALAALTLLSLSWSAYATPTPDQALIERGAYLASSGDCVACHTAKNGKPFAGGLPLSTPLGKVYSTNITPDAASGIGTWSYENFATLMRLGKTKSGEAVYPAMPYPSYAHVSDADMHALYAYFMHAVTPVKQANRANDIPWPLSMRWPLTIWSWAFGPGSTPYVAPTGRTVEVARGAYLVQGLGHCGSCHTPRGVALQELSLGDDPNPIYLAGGESIDGWIAPSLRNEHGGGLDSMSTEDIVAFLKSGRNTHVASFGAMNDVVLHSMQNMDDADLKSIASYLKSLSPRKDALPHYRYDPAIATALYHGQVPNAGAQIYLDRCAGCHRSDGKGNGKAFPALAGNPVLQTNDPTSAIHIVLTGGAMPATRTAPSAITMGPYAAILNDREIAEVVTFVQTSWGNQGGGATERQVAKLRHWAAPLPVSTTPSSRSNH